jgi:hypothetical protein
MQAFGFGLDFRCITIIKKMVAEHLKRYSGDFHCSSEAKSGEADIYGRILF